MQLRYLAPLVIALLAGIVWSVQGYLEADRELRLDLRLEQAELPPTLLPLDVAGDVGDELEPTARVLPPEGTPSSS